MRTIKFNIQDTAEDVEPVKDGDVFILEHPDGIFTVMVCPEDAEFGCTDCVLCHSVSCHAPRTKEGFLLCGPGYIFKSMDTVMEDL